MIIRVIVESRYGRVFLMTLQAVIIYYLSS